MDAEKIMQLFRQLAEMHPNNPECDDVADEIVDLLGDDEQKVIDFVNNFDDDMAPWLSMIYEETVAKFNGSEAVDDAIAARF